MTNQALCFQPRRTIVMLTNLCNTTIGHLPVQWKNADVIMLLKSDKNLVPTR